MKRAISLLVALAMLALCLPMAAMADGEPEYTYTTLTYQAGVLDDPCYMVDYWSKYYGVKFELENIEQGSESELIPLRLASGDVPDVLYWNRTQYMKLVEEGMYGTFPVETLQKYAPKIYEQMASKDGLIDYFSIDGELFCLGYQPQTSIYPSMGVWRKAWLDKLGEEMPSTLEDAERIWYRFAKEDPDGNGADDTYGLSKGGMTQVYNAYGLYTTWIKDENGNLINSNVSPRRKEALAKLAQYYADGVLDPEFITGENNGGYWGVSHAFTSGRIGYTVHGNYSHWPLTYGATTADEFANAGAMYQNFPDEVTETSMPYIYANPLQGPYGDVSYGTASYQQLDCFSTALIADEARFGRFLEIAEDLGGYNDIETYICNRYGERGVHWDYNEDGVPQSFEGYQTVAERVAIGGLIAFQFAMSDAAEPSLWGKSSLESLRARTEDINYVTSPLYVTSTLPSAADYQTELDKLTSETFMDIITGAKPIDAFDEMVSTWYAIGGEILTQEANDLYNK